MARKPQCIKRKSSPKGSSKPGASGDERAKASEVKQDSRLLSLAPEIRNQIYGYVLGGHKVHVYIDCVQDENTRRQGFCTHSCGSNLSVVQSEELRNVGTEAPCAACGRDRFTSLDLSLLRTCHQIYADTALLPYSTNDFLIETPAFTPFMKGLEDTQKASIEHMTVIGRGDLAWGINSFELEDIHGLQRVERLRLILVGGTPYDEFHGLENMAELPSLEEVLFTTNDKYCFFPVFSGDLDDSEADRYTADEFREEIL
ncbi:hypothetical protein CB0940_02540 [Cercospora beticola]|uniref:DUF7730 domain-containing protein n=1 Tax=Cercospora beticola TaxID=122368 RepID=A0A2G5I3E1_CERBT|nr:hypothetical protein CB0940_02540 [Cercospora beticola]PIA99268.1 hypothetical protein CB0940_02540 [Cercospora beticola]WPA99680.1 hypothetical protein RHO25_004298 [Cercospora beticola]CAK1362175.1 unnamed protein product [Cercospora beticola]